MVPAWIFILSLHVFSRSNVIMRESKKKSKLSVEFSCVGSHLALFCFYSILLSSLLCELQLSCNSLMQ